VAQTLLSDPLSTDRNVWTTRHRHFCATLNEPLRHRTSGGGLAVIRAWSSLGLVISSRLG